MGKDFLGISFNFVRFLYAPYFRYIDKNIEQPALIILGDFKWQLSKNLKDFLIGREVQLS